MNEVLTRGILLPLDFGVLQRFCMKRVKGPESIRDQNMGHATFVLARVCCRSWPNALIPRSARPDAGALFRQIITPLPFGRRHDAVFWLNSPLPRSYIRLSARGHRREAGPRADRPHFTLLDFGLNPDLDFPGENKHDHQQDEQMY